MGKFHHSKKNGRTMKMRKNPLLQDPSTILLKLEERSCLKISYILKITRVFGISSATSSTRDSQKKI